MAYFGLQQLRGLKNYDNTCWLNSIVQCLAQTPWFFPELHRCLNEEEDYVEIFGGTITINGETSTCPQIDIELNEGGLLTFCLYKTIGRLGNGNQTAMLPKLLIRNVTATLSQFPLGEHHDAHEFVKFFLEALNLEHEARYRIAVEDSLEAIKETNAEFYKNEEEQRELTDFYCSKAAKMFPSPVENLFRGSLQSIQQCMDCKTVTDRDEHLYDLSLPIPKSNYSKSKDEETILEERRKVRRSRFLEIIAENNYSRLFNGEFDSRMSLAICYRKLEDELNAEKYGVAIQEDGNEESNDLENQTFTSISPNKEDQTGSSIINPEKIELDDLDLTESSDDDTSEAISSLAEMSFEEIADRCYLKTCLDEFFNKELLSGDNKVVCNECTKRSGSTGQERKTETTKQYQLSDPPNILILHLKRFDFVGGEFVKNNTQIDFPNILDMAPYCTDKFDFENGCRPILYSLYAVNQHFGTLDAGHYISYRRLMFDYENGEQMKGKIEELKLPGQWIIADDESIYAVDEEYVMKAQAYILFYKRIF